MKKLAIAAVIFILLSASALWIAIANIPELGWRAKVVGDMAAGKIDDISWSELLGMLKPGSDYYLQRLAQTQNVYSVITNPYDSDADEQAGAEHYRGLCVSCHGAEAEGGVAPALTDGEFRHGFSDWAMYRNIRNGIDGTNMKAVDLDELQTWQVIAYLRSLNAEKNSAEEVPVISDYQAVSAQRLIESKNEPQNWLTYSGNYDGTRYSSLKQITAANVSNLQLKWIRQFESPEMMVEVTPLVNGDVMFLTEPPGTVHAVSAKTGKNLWTHQRSIPKDVVTCCGLVNRGVALYEELVFVGTLDAHLLALNAKTGKVVWDAEVDDYKRGIGITVAPLVVKNMVIVGVSGGEFGIRGYLDAYDIQSGERLWRFYTVPGPGEPGHDSWAGESWQTGGAPTWLTGAYDSELNLLYWGVGNPGPLYQAHAREGDNLYSCSVIALNPDDGSLQWHFQFTPNDEHDWDANQIPLLVDREWQGEQRKLMLWANRNAFYYILDRETGEFLQATPFAKQNWVHRIDENGRPDMRPEARVSVAGTLVWPSPVGAINWQSPSYHPGIDYLYLPVLEFGDIIFKQQDVVEYEAGEHFFGSGHQFVSSEQKFYTAVRALHPETGEMIWERRNPERRTWWKIGGVLSTAGNIVFGGDYSRMYALDAGSGDLLWELEVGGMVNASPMTHLADGEQRIVMAAGRSVFSFGLPNKSVDLVIDGIANETKMNGPVKQDVN